MAALVWGTRGELLVTEFERQNGRGDVTVRLDDQAVAELHELTADYLSRIGELGLQTRERRGERADAATTAVAVLVTTDADGRSCP